MRKILILFPILFSTKLYAEGTCLENSITQHYMNQCAGLDLKSAAAKLQRVLAEIRKHHKHGPEFLEKLDKSQKVWSSLVDSNLEMLYPLKNKQKNYGTVFTMCSAFDRTGFIIQRVAFLKKWLVGHGDGEVCWGSVYHSYCLSNDCSKL